MPPDVTAHVAALAHAKMNNRLSRSPIGEPQRAGRVAPRTAR
jgi:hypothetical protein